MGPLHNRVSGFEFVAEGRTAAVIYVPTVEERDAIELTLLTVSCAIDT